MRGSSMYTGTNKTALRSQQSLADALQRLMLEKPYHSISVSELCREADVSRQTYYTLFRSKENIISYTLNKKCPYEPEEGEDMLWQLCHSYRYYLVEHKDVLCVLMENDLMGLLYDEFYNGLMTCEHFLEEKSKEYRSFVADFIAGGYTSIARSYVRTGATTTPEMLDKIIYGLFSGAILLRQEYD